MKVYHTKRTKPKGRAGDKYYGYEKFWGHIVVFSDTNTFYCAAVLFSPCGIKRHELTATTYEALAVDCEHVEEGISEAEKRHFYNLLERASLDDLRKMLTRVMLQHDRMTK